MLPPPPPAPPPPLPRRIWCLSSADGAPRTIASDLLVLDLTWVSTDAKLWRLRLDCLEASLALDEELTDALLEETVEEEENDVGTRLLRWSDDEEGGGAVEDGLW